MTTLQSWNLKRCASFIPSSKGTNGVPWKVYEANDEQPGIVLTIVESGYLMVFWGHTSLLLRLLDIKNGGTAHPLINGTPAGDTAILLQHSVEPDIQTTVPLTHGSDFVKVQQKSDNLMLRFTAEGESRMIRMQFDGSSREEAIKACSNAVEKVMEYLPVTTQEDVPLPPNQTPAEVTAPKIQSKAAGAESDVVQSSLSIKQLAQHFLGETAATLPQVYRHSFLAQGDFELILRVCLLDPSFPAFVEKVEGELKKLLRE